jgi:hypothetical protein
MNIVSSICPRCGRRTYAAPYLLVSNTPQRQFFCTNSECKHQWTEAVQTLPDVPTALPNATDTHCTHEGRSFLKPCPVCAPPKTPAEKALERNEAQRELTVAQNQLRGLKWEVEQLQDRLRAARINADSFRALVFRVRNSGLVGSLCPCCQRSRPDCTMSDSGLAAEIELALGGATIRAPKEGLKMPEEPLEPLEGLEPLRAELVAVKRLVWYARGWGQKFGPFDDMVAASRTLTEDIAAKGGLPDDAFIWPVEEEYKP